MDRIVVSVVIRIGRRRITPVSISASSTGMDCRSILVESTNRIPLFTTIPISIKNPIRDIMLRVDPVKNKSNREPIRENGIHSMTIIENLGDSNCMAITKNTRNTAVKIALNRLANSSFIISTIILSAGLTDSGNTVSATMASMASCASKIFSEFNVEVRLTRYMPSCFTMVSALST